SISRDEREIMNMLLNKGKSLLFLNKCLIIYIPIKTKTKGGEIND
ncbi:MAG: hypothetical protein ACD_68C00133G0001, partial [uncultured bacterium]